ncbi:alanine racemase [Marinigracilibium pacificum]|uniref:D-serine deaminase-like pyridoxal phosphate-dependent protein n=1 Tax=Marinigracilibium pacificum TaxID=2729599 RepID=A0A848J115_9BACT|nr:alanine racemase [Marinigracilibium pacificum]NMM48174.1 hypothetical protein [Marinigracilibium pacificum]
MENKMDMTFNYPSLLINKNIAIGNIKVMAEKASSLGKDLRPHFKTHQSAEIGEWFREYGIDKIAVSSPQMAAYFAEHGWNDILIAFPVNIREIDLINQLANKITLGICISDLKVVEKLVNEIVAETDIWIELDVKYYRSGIDFSDTEGLQNIVSKIKKNSKLNFKGLMVHKGDHYTTNVELQKQKHFEAIEIIQNVREFMDKYSENYIVSYGDTPSCSSFDKFDGVDELRPGNFVFYDFMQVSFQACDLNNIAVCLSSPVVATYEDSRKVITYGGAVHLAKDFISGEQESFGKVVRLRSDGWDTKIVGNVDKVSQEHGIITWNEDEDLPLPGEVVGILPVHSCHTASTMGCYYDLNGIKINRFNVADLGHYQKI